MQNEIQQTVQTSVSLQDAILFLKKNYRLIIFCGLAGLIFSTIFLSRSPKVYEARWQLQMAQFASNNSFINIEEPVALIQRLRLPIAYSIEAKESCGTTKDDEIGDYLSGAFEIQTIKDVPSVVAMKFRAPSATLAKECAEAIGTMIVAQQRDLIADRMNGRHDQLTQYQQALHDENRQLETIKKSELSNFSYLAKLDKLSWLRTRIDSLQEEAILSQKHPAKLINPIYVTNKPVSPKKWQLIVLGILLGMVLGLMYAMVRQGWRKKM